MDAPRQIAIHPSVNKPRLILGADRELIISTGMIAAILVFALITWWSVSLGIALWLVSVVLLNRMGKEDSLMRKVYVRHVKYRAFYPAKASHHSGGVRMPRSWK